VPGFRAGICFGWPSAVRSVSRRGATSQSASQQRPAAGHGLRCSPHGLRCSLRAELRREAERDRPESTRGPTAACWRKLRHPPGVWGLEPPGVACREAGEADLSLEQAEAELGEAGLSLALTYWPCQLIKALRCDREGVVGRGQYEDVVDCEDAAEHRGACCWGDGMRLPASSKGGPFRSL